MKNKWMAAGVAAVMMIAAVPAQRTGMVRADEAASDVIEDVLIDETNFPDLNFRVWVSDNLDTASPTGILTPDEISAVTVITCENKDVADFTGIEVFTNTKQFHCSKNAVTSLDLHGLSELEDLTCTDCPNLVSLDVTGNAKLQRLSCMDSQLTELDLSANPELESLNCERNALSNLDLSKNPKLEVLQCDSNSIEQLDLSNHPELKQLSCAHNQLTNLNLRSNACLKELFCDSNKLTQLDLSGAPNLERLSCDNNQLSELDLSKKPNLKEVNCYYNEIEKIIFGVNDELRQLWCGFNKLTELDVTQCPKLWDLQCNVNQITRLRISNNSRLLRLGIDNNPISEIPIYGCPRLCEAAKHGSLHEYNYAIGDMVYWEYYYSHVPDTQDTSEWYSEIDCDEHDTFITEEPERKITVTTDGNGTASASADTAMEWDTITLTATPNEGYRFKEWQVISGYVTVTNNQFEVADADVEIKAIFEKIPYLITVTTDGNGTASASVTEGMTGTVVTLTATPNSGYVFKEWQVISGGVTIVDNSFTIGESDVEIKAIFEAAPTPEPGPATPEPAKDPSFEDFVERLYTVALGRASEAEGKAFWVDQVVNKGFTGADCARFFLLDAPEFLGRGLTDDEFVEILYLTFFDRASEPDGKAYWLGRLASGSPKADVVNDFIESTEWCNVCATYGVKSGAQWHKATIASKNAIKFATRLYTCCLGRDPEEDGLNYWSLALTNLEVSGYQAASLFFESPEFQGFNTSNEEYIKRLYTTFMDREADTDGFNYWLGLLNGGMSRSDALKTFAGCPEFQEICNKYGIDRGEI